VDPEAHVPRLRLLDRPGRSKRACKHRGAVLASCRPTTPSPAVETCNRRMAGAHCRRHGWLPMSGSIRALCPLRTPDHCRFASEAAAPRIGASPWLRSGAAAPNGAADWCFDDAPPRRPLARKAGERACASTSHAAAAAPAPAGPGASTCCPRRGTSSTRGPPGRCSSWSRSVRSLVVLHRGSRQR
jgi:hypothetical protein